MSVERKQHPKYNNFWCGKDGTVFDSNTGRTYPMSNHLKYPTLRRKYYDSKTGKATFLTLSIHRLIAEVWLPIPKWLQHLPEYKRIVNHIDHDTTNNSVSNLEWTDHSGNNIAAVNFGAVPQVRKVYVKDFTTGEITEYPSIANVGESLGMTRSAAYRVCNCLKPVTYNNKQFRFNPELFTPPEEIRKKKKNSTDDIVIKDIEKNKLYVVEGVSAVARAFKLGIKGDAFSKRVQKNYDPKKGYSFDKYTMWWLEDYKDNLSDAKRIKKKKSSSVFINKPKRIEVTDLKTEEKKIWDSFKNFIDDYNTRTGEEVKFQSAQRYVSKHHGYWKDMYHIKYLND